ncbi:7-keto-8-aminopelargonate synthetase [Rubidibacter lacunae KORDI 51-2]|uniref:7-keto-8-aminopelargonate synthetase n=1 Tax=Rubidibacter lacunae KORDI 51-2 TaxID=582515 RepID=U5DLE8_9CHRO|nr:aminotransferase class I/II-fold pyridoxal phosphate-dependent enzyme [Rubidibacter lacunae]ERN42501.1 7-keto-8-aminopelargonate synthetase [Rubidibacter lacunae KORDI 51-2]
MKEIPGWLKGSLLNYIRQKGTDLEERTSAFSDWISKRRQNEVWPYSRVLHKNGVVADVFDEFESGGRRALNFGSQDYLSLSGHPAVIEAAVKACQEFGVHSAGSPVLSGRTKYMLELEKRLSSVLRKDSCAIYATGWSAGFGVVSGLVRPNDSVVIDRLAHSCIAEGARHSTKNINWFQHNNLEEFHSVVQQAREKNPKQGLFVLLESLYSMDSDSPDLESFSKVTREYGGIIILDVAHDFGCMGNKGLGVLDNTAENYWPDIVMGSFSKSFASNGGFVAASSKVIEYLRYYSPSFTFTNALSPIQCAIVLTCFDVIFSKDGEALRSKLRENIIRLRDGMTSKGFRLGGIPSPIVPVFVGNEAKARLTSRALEDRNLLANLVEFPAVARGEARFRFQVMREHSSQDIDDACHIMAEATSTYLSEANREYIEGISKLRQEYAS